MKRLTLEEFNFIYNKVPRLCVDLAVVTSNGFVLTRRVHPPAVGLWHLPGGTVMKGEKLIDTVYRIAQEELNLEADDLLAEPEMVGVIEYDFSAEGYEGFPVGIGYVLRVEEMPEMGRDAEEIAVFAGMPDDMIPEQRQFVHECVHVT